MAISVVQHKSAASGSSVTSGSLAFTSSVTAGNILLVLVSVASSHNFNKLADSQGNQWSLVVGLNPGQTSTPAMAAIYSCVAKSSGADTVTVTYEASASSGTIHIYEISGATVVDQIGTNYISSFGSSATVSTSGATTGAAELVLAFFAVDNTTGTWTAGGSYLAMETASPTAAGSFSEILLPASAGTQTATATYSGSDVITGLIVTFFAATDPVTNSVPSGTPLTKPEFTAKFLFFDTGDYSAGI